MKLLFLSVACTCVVPLAVFTSNNQGSAVSLQSQTTQVSLMPQVTSVSLTNNWYNYTENDSKYTAKFPSQPKVSNESKRGKYKSSQAMYEDEAKNRVYLTTSAKYFVAPSQFNAEAALDRVRESQVQRGDTIISEKKITLNDFPGRELIIQTKKHMTIKMRMFINPNDPTLFMALVLAGNGNINFPEADAFLNSLAFAK